MEREASLGSNLGLS